MSQAIAKSSKTLKSFNQWCHYHHKVCNTSRTNYSSSFASLIKPFSFVKNYNTLNYSPTNNFQNPNKFETKPLFDQSSFLSDSEPQFNQNPNKSSYFSEAKAQFNQNPNKSLYFSETEPQCNQNPNKSSCLSETKPQIRQKPTRVYDQTCNSDVNYFNHQNYQEIRDVSSTQPDELRGTIEELDLLCKERKLKEAVEVLGLLERNNVPVDVNRFLLLMNECGETQALEEARKVHESLLRSLSSIDVCICNKILEMYAKCGSMENAYSVFDKMSQRNLTTWDTMITWFAKNGHGEEAIDMFTEFKRIGLKPDSQMFFGVFTACSIVGDMKEGLLHFESMSKNYDIVPSMVHFKSVMDMLGSAGYLNDALHFIEKMPMEPSVEIWETLMHNCRVHGDTELGDRCYELIELLDPTRLDEQTKAGLIPIKASDIVKEKEKKRLSSLNPLEIRTKVYEYRAGDTSHPEHQKLYSQLRCLKQTMIEAGYVPETKCALHDVDQESKEAALLSHSERLALSQALLTTPARSLIRITKNIRTCNDCHAALKIISKIVGRLIVARDKKRFHHFKDGVCSCGDYW